MLDNKTNSGWTTKTHAKQLNIYVSQETFMQESKDLYWTKEQRLMLDNKDSRQTTKAHVQ